MDLVAKIEENILRRALLPESARVLAAVSGGVDSVVMAYVLHRLAEKHGWRMEIAHFNHQLRGLESDEDEALAARLAGRLGTPFHRGSGDVPALAREKGWSIEMAGRELRHRFFVETAERLGLALVVLAHHADDQVETFWLRLLRGEVGTGLRGIRWKAPSLASARVELVRPFLNISKQEITDYARTEALPFRDDASNRERVYLRNRLRLEVLPALRSLQPHLEKISLRAVDVLGAEKEFLAAQAADWMRARTPPFEAIHLALQREVLRLQLLELQLSPDFELIEQLREHQRAITIRPGFRVRRGERGEIFLEPPPRADFDPQELRFRVDKPGTICFKHRELAWELVSQRGPFESNLEYFDAGAVGPEITLRHWRAGDRFRPIGAAQPSKLQDLFTNLKIPPESKRGRLLAVSAGGEIFWVEGLRIGEAFKVRTSTAQVLKWSWRKSPSSST